MAGSAQPVSRPQSTWTAPAVVPPGGDWVASLNGYGDVEYLALSAQANRTMSVVVTALDETGKGTELKARPVIGMWAASDPEGTAPPAFTPSALNQATPGMTRLDAQVATSSNFLIGISDERGDGRPDYRYHAQVLYADSVSPSRLGVNGGAVTVKGSGFAPGLTTSVGSITSTPLAVSAGQMILSAPANADGPQSITITDPVSGASSVMTNALTYGAAPTDNIVLVGSGLNPPTPVGTQATTPMMVRVLAADGVTPISGATIAWSASNGVQLSACGNASACSIATDPLGEATTFLVPSTGGVATITATLAPAAYGSSKAVGATLYATQSASDLGVSTPYLWISQGVTASIPLTARALSNGTPRNNVQVNFNIVGGSATLSAASAQTNSSGYATVNLTVTQFAAPVQVSACVVIANGACRPIYVNPVPLASQNLQPVSGNGQVSTGSAFQPIMVRVTDSASPPNPVIAASVSFLTTILRPGGNPPAGSDGETRPSNPATSVILQVSQSSATTDVSGLASIVPSSGGFSAPLEVDVAVTTGTSATLDYPLEMLPAAGNAPSAPQPVIGTIPVRAVPSTAIEENQRSQRRAAQPTPW